MKDEEQKKYEKCMKALRELNESQEKLMNLVNRKEKQIANESLEPIGCKDASFGFHVAVNSYTRSIYITQGGELKSSEESTIILNGDDACLLKDLLTEALRVLTNDL